MEATNFGWKISSMYIKAWSTLLGPFLFAIAAYA